jgi:arylsulfatase A-like enzyme
MNQNQLKSMALLTAGLGLLNCQAQQKKETQLPNIVFIVSDDMGWKDLACYGNTIHETPNIDRLAKESVRFTDAYASSPVCTPTRASIMTGKYPARLHMTVWSENARDEFGYAKGRKLIPAASVPDLPLEEFTIAEILKTKGYNTAHVGKWHLGESMFYPENHGFDVSIGGGSWGAPPSFFYPYKGIAWRQHRYIPGLELSGGEENSYFKNREGEYLTDRLTDEAIRIMEDAVKTNAPFFMNLNYYAVHTPIEAPENLVKYYSEKIAKSGKKSNPTYAAMVHKVDENVGRVLKALQNLGISDITVVIFTSDNGGYIGKDRGMVVADNSPLRSGKGSLYEGGIRIPLIIKYPGVSQRNVDCNAPVLSADLYPTVCEIAGIKTDTIQLDGLSMMPLIQDSEATLSRECLFWHYPHYYETTTPVTAVRYKHWKLLKYYEGNEIELYNLNEDIGEKQNLTGENAVVVNEITTKLNDWLMDTRALLPSPNPNFVSK